MDVTETVSVMRRGEMTATVRTSDTNPQELAELMVGRKVLLRVDKKKADPGRKVLEIEDLRVMDDDGVERLKGISLDLRQGEILGIAGVAGNGQSELLQVLGGCRRATGRIRLNGEEIDPADHALDGQVWRGRGVSHVPEDRQREGLILDFFAWENMAFGYHHAPEYQKSRWLMNNAAIRRESGRKMERFDVRPPIPGLAARNFSGGNQQKIVLAREIERDPDVLLVGQPTRGVDIGAIEFIHQQIVELRDRGKAILLLSVETRRDPLACRPHRSDVRRADHGRTDAGQDQRARARPTHGGNHGRRERRMKNAGISFVCATIRIGRMLRTSTGRGT